MTTDIADDRAVLRLAKRQADGEDVGILKHRWMAIINGRATDLYGDAGPRAFTKTITEDPVGRELYRALKASPGNEVEVAPDEPEDTDEERARAAGPNHLKMHFLAVDQQRLTGKSYPQAYTHVYADSNNRALRTAVHNEHVAGALQRMGMA